MQHNRGLDIGKLIFALLIPFLHIPFKDGVLLEIISQYFARLGVPYFFAVSGYFLSISIKRRGSGEALLKYASRVGMMLIVWIIVYIPLFLKDTGFRLHPIQTLLFLTPGYLWYLTAMVFASIVYCLVKNRKLLYAVAGILFTIGTLGGGATRGSFQSLLGTQKYS